jgi:hypothetical protein
VVTGKVRVSPNISIGALKQYSFSQEVQESISHSNNDMLERSASFQAEPKDNPGAAVVSMSQDTNALGKHITTEPHTLLLPAMSSFSNVVNPAKQDGIIPLSDVEHLALSMPKLSDPKRFTFPDINGENAEHPLPLKSQACEFASLNSVIHPSAPITPYSPNPSIAVGSSNPFSSSKNRLADFQVNVESGSRVRDKDNFDFEFMAEVNFAISAHFGESNVRLKFQAYIQRFVAMAATYEALRYGKTYLCFPSPKFARMEECADEPVAMVSETHSKKMSLGSVLGKKIFSKSEKPSETKRNHSESGDSMTLQENAPPIGITDPAMLCPDSHAGFGAVWLNEDSRQRDLEAHAGVIEAWRAHSPSYQNYISDRCLQSSLWQSSGINLKGRLDIQHQIQRFQSDDLDSKTVQRILLLLLEFIQTSDDITEVQFQISVMVFKSRVYALLNL